MPNLDNNIYGLDETSAANAVSDKALGGCSCYMWSGAPTATAESKDGAETSRATKFQSGGGKQPGSVALTERGMGNDSRANVKGNHGKQG